MTHSLLTQRQTAQYLQCSLRTLGYWRARRYGPPYLRVGRAVLYRLDDLERFLTQCRVTTDALDGPPK